MNAIIRVSYRTKSVPLSLIDSEVLGTLIKGLEGGEDYSIMILPIIPPHCHQNP